MTVGPAPSSMGKGWVFTEKGFKEATQEAPGGCPGGQCLRWPRSKGSDHTGSWHTCSDSGQIHMFPGSSGSPWEAESPEGDFSREKLEEGRVDKGGCGAAKGGPALLSREQNQVGRQRGVLRDTQNDA